MPAARASEPFRIEDHDWPFASSCGAGNWPFSRSGQPMNPKKPRDKRELCYPFIFETQFQCDYEIATDELCCQGRRIVTPGPRPRLRPCRRISRCCSGLSTTSRLGARQARHLRGGSGVAEGALRSLQRGESRRVTGFVLPQAPPIPTLHLCRCGSKKVRLLVRLEESGVRFDPILHRFANLLANFSSC